MNRRSLQLFFAALFAFPVIAQSSGLEPGHVYRLIFTDVDGKQISIPDGRVTIITVATTQAERKAHIVGDSVPEQYVGDSRYRLITVMNFQNQINRLFQGIISATVRRRLDTEAARVQPRYLAKHIAHSPRQDLFAVADFDGQATIRLGMEPSMAEFAVFLFDGRGRLLRRWRDIPPREELAAALATAQL